MATQGELLTRADETEALLVEEMAERLKAYTAVPSAFAYRWQQMKRARQLANLNKLQRSEDLLNDISNGSSV